jgi:16S rRNA (cytidine1402-2'-O)-methyltransferase
MSVTKGIFYVIATPIGNLSDITQRAAQVLGEVDHLFAEDTRHTLNLCRHLGVSPPLHSLHEHNEQARIDQVLGLLQSGSAVGLVSDAGTPLISDPGYRIVAACHEAGIQVSPVPGVSALSAALSVCGLPTDQFGYHGFPPARRSARLKWLEALRDETASLVFFESRHRIVESLADMVQVFGAEREAAVCRELTKTFETIWRAPLAQLLARTRDDDNAQRGEFVVVVSGALTTAGGTLDVATEKLLMQLAQQLPPRKAAGLIADYTGLSKRDIYQRLMEMQQQ